MWKSLAVVVVLAGVVAVLLPLLARPSNCGGNSAALNDVKLYVLMVELGINDTVDRTFRVTALTGDQRDELSRVVRDHWIRGARFLVSTNPVHEADLKSRRILIVCDTPFQNVPQRRFGSAPPTYAVGYSDGTKGLLGVGEFAALDFTTFRFLDELIQPASTNSGK
jgi:hypothetical protein